MFKKNNSNKGEGPVGGWKLSLIRELKNLEENIDQIYSIVNLQTNSIIIHDADESQVIPKADSGVREKDADYQTIVNDFVVRVNVAAENIDALLNTKTEFDLPIPVYIILRLAAKVGSVRWKDYNHKPNGLAKSYVYSLTPYLIQVNLIMFKSLIQALGTNIIPFTPFINQTILRILEWTRTSNLLAYNETQYYSVRVQQYRIISLLVEQLSLNINLEPHQLETLIVVELLDGECSLGNDSMQQQLVQQEQTTMTSTPRLAAQVEETESRTKLCLQKSKHTQEAWSCLDKLYITYAGLFDGALEHKVQSYVIHGCVRIYRDFEASSEVISLECRRQLLSLLETIANQPYATSSTEISHHIFELAEKLESDQEIRCFVRTALRKGLAHRPIIVSSHDVHNLFERPMLTESVEVEFKEKTGESQDEPVSKESDWLQEMGFKDIPATDATTTPVAINV